MWIGVPRTNLAFSGNFCSRIVAFMIFVSGLHRISADFLTIFGGILSLPVAFLGFRFDKILHFRYLIDEENISTLNQVS